MKKLAIALAITTLAITPAFAKSKHSQKSTTQTTGDPSGSDAYAYAPADQSQMRGHDVSQTVYAFGQYQGADPDPNIRLQLLRDPPTLQQ